MVEIYSQSQLDRVPDGVGFDNSYWHYLLMLERDFNNTLQYVHLDDKNLNTYSLEFSKQLINISTEFETIAKMLCKEINGNTAGNISQYKETIIHKFPKIWSTPVYIDKYNQMEFYPLKNWKEKGGKLGWWTAYNNIKHERHKYFREANLKNVLDSLGSLLIIETYLYKISFKNISGIRYGTTLLRLPELAEAVYLPKGTLPDF
jgi:hypothetical protein